MCLLLLSNVYKISLIKNERDYPQKYIEEIFSTHIFSSQTKFDFEANHSLFSTPFGKSQTESFSSKISFNLFKINTVNKHSRKIL